MSEVSALSLRVNGSDMKLQVSDGETLLETLRDGCGLNSVRYACGIGVCGSCTVLIDGHAASACLLLTRMVKGLEITTAETDQANDMLDRTRRAFLDAGAYQCSYCTPALVLTTYSLLKDFPGAATEEYRELLSGNLCRCGCYPQVQDALEMLGRESEAIPPCKERNGHERSSSIDHSHR